MKKKISNKQNLQTAETEKRCIWMTAGVISYKLCPLNYDCEHCDLDKAMRSEVKSRKIKSSWEKEGFALSTPKNSSLSPILFFTYTPGEVKKGYYLHPSHLWVQQLDGQNWRVGIDELLAYVLPQPIKFEFSVKNNDLIHEQHLGKIVSPAGAVYLISPLSGRLIQSNPELIQYPELIQQDPYDKGWLATIEWTEDHTEFEKFFTEVRAKRHLQEEAQHLNFLLRHRGVEVSHIGETLPDGGVNLKYLHQILPAKVCLRLANELTATGKQGW